MKKIIVSAHTFRDFINQCLSASMQEEYRAHLRSSILQLDIETAGPKGELPFYVNVTSNFDKQNWDLFLFTINRKSLARLDAILHLIYDQPITINFGTSGFEDPVVSFCV